MAKFNDAISFKDIRIDIINVETVFDDINEYIGTTKDFGWYLIDDFINAIRDIYELHGDELSFAPVVGRVHNRYHGEDKNLYDLIIFDSSEEEEMVHVTFLPVIVYSDDFSNYIYEGVTGQQLY